MLERDAEELFDLTAKGLTFFGEQFAMPFPQPRYYGALAPEMGGAMENYGCVTWSATFIYRDPPSYSERERRALVLLHEMAHMWFGDMVTMRWWDDLWLNESFAEWACGWAAVGCTEFTDMWARMLATEKQDAYAADAGPTTHPIRQELPDVATAEASFDDITYPKGAAVLKQLVAYVGEAAFVAGLRSYFRRHAWGNTTLDDLVAEVAEASGRDLTAWVEGWLETSGTDRLTLELEDGGLTLVAAPPEGRGPLPHRLLIGAYADRGDELALVESLSVEVTGERTRVEPGVEADLWLVNDDDLTFAVVHPRGVPGPAAVPWRPPPDGGGSHPRGHDGVEPALRRRADRPAARRLRRARAAPRDRRLRRRAVARSAGRGGRRVGSAVGARRPAVPGGRPVRVLGE